MFTTIFIDHGESEYTPRTAGVLDPNRENLLETTGCPESYIRGLEVRLYQKQIIIKTHRRTICIKLPQNPNMCIHIFLLSQVYTVVAMAF